MATTRIKPSPPLFQVGDTIRFRLAIDDVEGEITEDRGNLGYEGRRLYGVRFSINPGEFLQTEVPEEDLTLISRTEAPVSGARKRKSLAKT